MVLEANESEADAGRRLRRERRQLVAVKLLQDFAQNSTLHGLRYIAERGLSLVEKLFWTAAFVTSLSLCAMLIWNVWGKWETNPIIVTLSEQLVSIGEVPFPSVTICPEVKVKDSVYTDSDFRMWEELLIYKSSFLNLTQDEIEGFERHEDISLICKQTNHYQRDYSDAKIVENIFEVSPTVNDVFRRCQLHQRLIPCMDLFKPVLTEEGVCFTMNSLAANEIFRVDSVQGNYSYLITSNASKGWSHSNGYASNETDVYPIRGWGNDGDSNVDILLSEEPALVSHHCNIYTEGYKVYLHHPADMPQSTVYYYSALSEQSVSFALKFSVMETSSRLRNYPPKKRQCYFPEERRLRYFFAYTASNCRLECQSNYTFDRCGCVWFHMPHYSSSTICRSAKQTCVSKALENYTAEEGRPDTEVGRCQCLPLCNSIQYDAEVRTTKFNKHKYSESVNYVMPASFYHIKDDIVTLNMARLEFYYKAPQFVSMRRSELFGLTDFLANCGGLLGLFLGFSFLSLVEIACFLTLRLGRTLRTDIQLADNTIAKNE